MNEKAFFDTNLVIAFVFHINSLHNKSKKAFDSYSAVYWSDFVQLEFKRRYVEKFKNLSRFFHDFQLELKNPESELYSLGDMLSFVGKNYSGKSMDDIKGSLNPFWNEYVGIESKVPFFSMKNKIDQCLNDLLVNSSVNKNEVLTNMKLTPKRTRKYSNIDRMLKYLGVKDADRTVTLDGHDFACSSSEAIDFVTFDDDCFNGARNVGNLCFASIKGKYDFNAF